VKKPEKPEKDGNETPRDIKARLKRDYEAAWAVGGNLDVFDNIYTPNCFVHHNPFEDIVGVEALKNGIRLLKTVFPDLHLIIDGVIACEDMNKGLGLYTQVATHPTTGGEIRFSGMSFTYLEDGKVAEEVSFDDNLTFLSQLGVLEYGTPGSRFTKVAKEVFPIAQSRPSTYMSLDTQAKPLPAQGVKMRESLEAAFNRGELEALEEVYAPGCVIRNYPFGDLAGLEELKRYVTIMRSAFPDLVMSIDDTFTSGGEGATVRTHTGTNTVFLSPFPPTGKRARWRGASRIFLQDGKIVEEEIRADYTNMMLQLGLVRGRSPLTLLAIIRAGGFKKVLKAMAAAGRL
jgi:predicted ester cyclase